MDLRLEQLPPQTSVVRPWRVDLAGAKVYSRTTTTTGIVLARGKVVLGMEVAGTDDRMFVRTFDGYVRRGALIPVTDADLDEDIAREIPAGSAATLFKQRLKEVSADDDSDAMEFFRHRQKSIDVSTISIFQIAIAVAIETKLAPYLADLCVDDVPIGDDSLKVLAVHLSNWLRRFSARRSGITNLASIKRLRRLRSLTLDGNSIGTSALTDLSSGLPLLTNLDLRGVGLLDIGDDLFIDGPPLETLDCGENGLPGSKAAALVLASFFDGGRVTDLDLSGTAFGDAGAKAIAAVLAVQDDDDDEVPSSSFLTLRLNKCHIGRGGLDALLDACWHTKSRGQRIDALDLDGNALDGDAVVKCLRKKNSKETLEIANLELTYPPRRRQDDPPEVS